MTQTVKITVIGCGVVGACIAYELSALPNVEITVLEARSQPGLGCSSAALGICMGVISHKTKGRNWRLRSESLKRYETLIPELTAASTEHIPFNRQGIVKLCGIEETWESWQTLQTKRQHQGYELDLWTLEQVQAQFPAVNYHTVQGAIYSPQDRQVDPLKLTQTLVKVCQQRGVRFCFNTALENLFPGLLNRNISDLHCSDLNFLDSDYIILTAGIGNKAITGETPHQPQFQPVLGQAWEVSLPEPLWVGSTDSEGSNHGIDRGVHPVLTGRDIHFAPLENPPGNTSGQSPESRYWVGATVEFPADQDPSDPIPSETIAAELWQAATDLCPPLAEATIQRHWWGLRPRPLNQAAPVLQWSDTVKNLLWATGHYRNGVFLAPGTALWVKDQILQKLG
jgi:glycine/D-amino acid oxidase-like deaminating enzyme